MSSIQSGGVFTVHTGNLNNCLELVTHRYKNSASEITAAFKYLAAEKTVFPISETVFSPNVEVLQHPITDVKTSLKVCLSSFSADDVGDAVRIALETIQLGTLSQLIVSFPHEESGDLSDDDWLRKVTPIWSIVESLVKKNVVHSVGVSDLDVDRLRILSEAAKEYPPTIDHYSIDGCCTVPKELVDYAKNHDIQLLTHNDPRNLELDTEVIDSVDKITGFGKNLSIKWASRYTIWIRSRSVMAAKGYLVCFMKH